VAASHVYGRRQTSIITGPSTAGESTASATAGSYGRCAICPDRRRPYYKSPSAVTDKQPCKHTTSLRPPRPVHLSRWPRPCSNNNRVLLAR
jgi:hypothetical protein